LRIGAVLLAAGEGRRFGGNKLIKRFMGDPIIVKSLRALDSLERVVVVGAYAKELLDYLPDEIVIYNPWWREGMSTSVRLGLRFFADYDAVLFHLADMPLITKETVSVILSGMKEGCDAVVPVHEGRRGNPVVVTKKLFTLVNELKGDVGFREVLYRANTCEVPTGPEVLIDVDTEEDLARLSSSERRPL
jgi:Uncharacterized MobA-related protein